jgi:hypothetical protein
MSDEKDGVYCKICGGIIPQDTAIGSIEVDGKSTGINQLDYILNEVAALHLQSTPDIRNELIKRVKVLNYIPTKSTEKYADGLFRIYKERLRTKEEKE